jgi:hypothetical protein
MFNGIVCHKADSSRILRIGMIEDLRQMRNIIGSMVKDRSMVKNCNAIGNCL